MIALLLGLALAMGEAESSMGHVDASLEFEGELLNHRFVDIDGDGVFSLCLALRSSDGRRELRILDANRRGFDSTPRHSISILEDVLAYGFADVREEPGRELIFLTRSGAYSYSLTREGYRGNIERLLTHPMLYDVPDSRALPYWEYVIPSPGGDWLLLPGRSEFALWAPAAQGSEEQAKPYQLLSSFGSGTKKEDEPNSNQEEDSGFSVTGSGEIRVQPQSRAGGVFLTESDESSTLLADGKSYLAPALVDVNADGLMDLVLQKNKKLFIHLTGADGIPREPSRVEEFPEYLLVEDSSLNLEFVHLNGDDNLDLLVRIQEEIDGFENAQMRVLVLLNDGERLIPEEAHQIFRFEAAVLRLNVADVNDDGRADLLMRKFSLPSMLETVSGLEFEMNYLAYLAEKRGRRPFERKAVLNQTETFDESNVGDAVKRRSIEFDCDGDGTPDLVEVDLAGRIVIRRLRHESGFFSGESWELDESPWKRFDVRGRIGALDVVDINGDGLGDLVSPSRHSLTLLLSTGDR